MNIEKIILGAGCFWGVEDALRELSGVVSTAVGYSGGFTENPTYEDVCYKNTGHTEVVEVQYDISQISLQDILNVFWEGHEPTHKMKEQYKSVIFYFTDQQKDIAEKSKDTLIKSKKYQHEIKTDILPAQAFYKAEEYHQQYYEKHRIKFNKYVEMCKGE